MQVLSFRKLHLLPVLLIAGLLAVAGCGSDADGSADGEDIPSYTVGPPLTDSALAVVVSSESGGDTLTADAFRALFEQATRMTPAIELDVSQAAELRRVIVEQFVVRHALLGEAERRDLAADSVRVEARLAQIQRQMGGAERFEELLASRDMTMEELRRRLRDQLLLMGVRRALTTEIEPPTEEELAAFREEQSQEIRAQHILFPVPRGASAAQEDSVRALAMAVLDSIESDQATFAELARRHSQDGSASVGGDLGYFNRSQMVDPFAEAAFALEDSGDVVEEPVRTQFGYHLIRKTGERTGTPVDTSRARRLLMQQRRREAFQQGVYRLRADLTVRINPDVVEGLDLEEPFDLFEPRF